MVKVRIGESAGARMYRGLCAPPPTPGCQMEESQCVLKYSCTLSYSPFLMCTSVPAGPGPCMSIHFISNYSPSSGRTQVTPSWTELYLDKRPSWKLSTSVSLTPRPTSGHYQIIPTCSALKEPQNIQVSLFYGLGLVGDSAGLIEVVSISWISKTT